MADGKFKVFCGTANPTLCDAICRYLGVPRGEAEHGRFSDGETRYQIRENVRGADVFVVQPCSNPVDFHLMQLLLMIDAFKRASAWRITPVIPYYPYARQDRKDRPRVAISAKLVADLLETAGASRVLSLDLHAPLAKAYIKLGQDEQAVQVLERSLAEWQKALPADYEPDKVNEVDSQLKDLKRRLAQKSSSETGKRQ